MEVCIHFGVGWGALCVCVRMSLVCFWKRDPILCKTCRVKKLESVKRWFSVVEQEKSNIITPLCFCITLKLSWNFTCICLCVCVTVWIFYIMLFIGVFLAIHSLYLRDLKSGMKIDYLSEEGQAQQVHRILEGHKTVTAKERVRRT